MCAKVLAMFKDVPPLELKTLFPNCTQPNLDKLVYVAQPTLTPSDLKAFSYTQAPVMALYGSAVAINTADYNDFPIGSYILDPKGATPAIYLKTAATTWKLQAINT